MSFLIAYVLIFISGIMNGIMDTIDHHWDISIFEKLPHNKFRRWMRGTLYWIDVDKHWYKWLGFPYMFEDAWHNSKGWMGIFAIAYFIFTYKSEIPGLLINSVLYLYMYVLGTVISWTVGKEIMYKYILLKKEYR